MTHRPEDAADVDPSLRAAVREIEAHVAASGWDQPARLYALVPASDLLAREPQLAQALGIIEARPGELTPIEQELAPEQPLEETLEQIMWPAEVLGAAAVVERLVLPPSADAGLPDEESAARAYAEAHPDRQEVRIVAAATRDGATHCALRLRAHDDDMSVVEGVELVPGLLQLLHGTLGH